MHTFNQATQDANKIAFLMHPRESHISHVICDQFDTCLITLLADLSVSLWTGVSVWHWEKEALYAKSLPQQSGAVIVKFEVIRYF